MLSKYRMTQVGHYLIYRRAQALKDYGIAQ